MTPAALAQYLDGLVRHRLMLSTMIWGPPGIGKSSIMPSARPALNDLLVRLRLKQSGVTSYSSSKKT